MAVSAGGFYTTDDAALPAAVQLARAIGAPRVVACVRPEIIDAVRSSFPEDLVLCVENHWDQALAKPSEVLRVLEGRPELTACLDTGHAILARVQPQRFATTLAGRLAHVHLKDAARPSPIATALGRKLRKRLQGRPAPVFPGEGDLDIGAFFAALRSIGFEGAVTVEHEGERAEAALAALLAACPPAA